MNVDTRPVSRESWPKAIPSIDLIEHQHKKDNDMYLQNKDIAAAGSRELSEFFKGIAVFMVILVHTHLPSCLSGQIRQCIERALRCCIVYTRL